MNSSYTDILNLNWYGDYGTIRRSSNLERVHFINSEIESVSKYFTNLLEKCVSLKFTNGTVKKVFIDSKLWLLTLNNTSTENVVIEPGQDYKLRALIISKSKLTKVPENINQLKHINRIDIVDNLIEHITLNDFDGLNNLYEIDLSRNRIKHVDTNGLIRFRELYNLKFSNNQLQQLDTCGWDMPSLYMLHVDHNNLTHFAVNHLRALIDISLRSNPLNCAWVQNLANSIGKRSPLTIFYMLFRGDITCEKESLDDTEMHCPTSIEHQRQQNFGLNNRLHTFESMLKTLESQIIEHQKVVNNVMKEL